MNTMRRSLPPPKQTLNRYLNQEARLSKDSPQSLKIIGLHHVFQISKGQIPDILHIFNYIIDIYWFVSGSTCECRSNLGKGNFGRLL